MNPFAVLKTAAVCSVKSQHEAPLTERTHEKTACADTQYLAFFDEMAKLSGAEHIVPGALWGAGSGAAGGALAAGEDRRLVGASQGALVGGLTGGALAGLLGPGGPTRVIALPSTLGAVTGAIGTAVKDRKVPAKQRRGGQVFLF